jgi:hypothetical protein
VVGEPRRTIAREREVQAMAVTNREETKAALRGGAVAGVVGGVALSIYMLARALVQGVDVWANAVKGAAAPFFGMARTMEPGFDLAPVVVGTLAHFAISIGWGLLFGLLCYGLSKTATLVASVAWGLVVWIGMYYVVLPLVGLAEMVRGAPVVSAIASHLVFGIAVGIGFLPFQRPRPAFFRRRRAPEVPAPG